MKTLTTMLASLKAGKTAEAILALEVLLAPNSQLISTNQNTPNGITGIAPLELELLRAVLPSPYTLVNEGTEDLALWDGDDWQYPIRQWDTAKGLITKIIDVQCNAAELAGTVRVQHQVKNALGL